ncbi:U2 small nuclear ribonucleoprotein auxiliary factor 35 kDa subunit-related protein 2 [Planoprotostelium fungivorum]|uniref:U2 small nuclear ribonucleoprotein auxiliary factor 35 kDa subunit-related protein 2 n=1 Tax=Planoprotostelium fungivorum TaxID=1890364 RepID=A0A2P6MST0_9EUKA|nr:U2 small nuclear ribonucleoprotein auxiliary factor 35 kDa subunit-related protein 2 [Planoprotostelium fungivorum]
MQQPTDEVAESEHTTNENTMSRREKMRQKKKQKRSAKRISVAITRPIEEEEIPLISEEEQNRIDEEMHLEEQKALEEWMKREQEIEEENIRKLQREKEESERKEKEKKERKEKQEKMMEERKRIREAAEAAAEAKLREASNPAKFTISKDSPYCPFFLKTGCCRYENRCSKMHPRPEKSTTLLFPNMYEAIGLADMPPDEEETLQVDEKEAAKHFLDFYSDVIVEFEIAGKIRVFKVSNNHTPQLRGNVYVQYHDEQAASYAYQTLVGRFYAGRQLFPQYVWTGCDLSPVTEWRSAICGAHSRGKCSRGRDCNFLHVYKNPRDEFNVFSSFKRDIGGGRIMNQLVFFSASQWTPPSVIDLNDITLKITS